MSTSMKKISAAAFAAVVGLSVVSRAASIPYFTSFETAPAADAEGQTYNAGTLATIGAGTPPSVGQNNWTAEDTENTVNNATAVVQNNAANAQYGSQSVLLTTTGNGSTGSPLYSDYYNATVADHTGSIASTPGTAYPTVAYQDVNTSFGMDTHISTGNTLTGMEIFDSNDDVIASVFTAHAVGGNVLYTENATLPPEQIDTANGFASNSFAPADGTYGTYTISINATGKTYTVADGGNSYTLALPSDFSGSIGGFAFATIDQGNIGSANFDNLSVVTSTPEPASIAMIGLGGLLLLAKRPKRLA
jgi:hypothetical protein